MKGNSRTHRSAAMIVTALAVLASVAVGQEETLPGDGAAMTIPAVTLAPLDEAASRNRPTQPFAQWSMELDNLASAAADPVTRADLYLGGANLALAHTIESECSGYLLHVDRRTSAESIRAILPTVNRWLDGAQESIEQAQQDSPPPDDWLRRSRSAAKALRAFARAIEVATRDQASDQSDDLRRLAQSGLSALLESDDPLVPPAALLWSTELAQTPSDLRRAMRSLELVLDKPDSRVLHHAFYLRLSRCRLIAKAGGFGTALALLKQLDARCDAWFRGDHVAVASRTAALVELQVLRQWHEALGQDGAQRERKWCAERFGKLLDTRFADSTTVLRLGSVVPTFVSPPNLSVQPPLPDRR